MTWVLLVAGCAADRGAGRATIVIPAASESAAHDVAPPPRAEAPAESDTSDPYTYFVGRWNGLVNGKLGTELTVNDGGAFHIRLPLQKHRPACDLFGKLRVSERRVYFDIEQSTCEAEHPGSTLEREIVTKSEDLLEVKSDDGRMTIRYTRQKAP
jgi:hypothetical protein